MKAYKIRKFQNGRNREGQPFINYSLTIPSQIAEQLPESMQFECELTDEGILFRPSEPTEESVKLPEWAKAQNGAKMAEAKTKSQKRQQRKRPERKTQEVPA